MRREGLAQRPAREPPPGVPGHADELGVHHLARGRDRAVGPAGRGHPPGPGAGRVPVPGGAPGRDERGQVADRPTRHEHAAGALGHPHEVGDPPQGLVLRPDGARALEPGAGVDRARPDDEVEDDRGVARRARDEGQVARVVDRQARRGQLVGEHPHRLGAAEPCRGDRRAEGGVEVLLRARPVERRRHPDPVPGVRGHGAEEVGQLLVGVGRVVGGGVHARSLGAGAPEEEVRELLDPPDEGVRLLGGEGVRHAGAPAHGARRPCRRRGRLARRRSRRRRRRTSRGPHRARRRRAAGAPARACAAWCPRAPRRRRRGGRHPRPRGPSVPSSDASTSRRRSAPRPPRARRAARARRRSAG